MTTYLNLEKQFTRIHSIEHALSMLAWDEAVMMPSGSGEARAKAMAELKVLKHEILTSNKMRELVETTESEGSDLSGWQIANFREIKMQVQNARAVDSHLVEAIALANSRCEQAWRSLRSENNWTAFLPFLDQVVRLSREEAAQRSSALNLSPYDCLLQQFNPGLRANQINNLFDASKKFLPDLIGSILALQKTNPPSIPLPPVPIKQQEILGLDIMNALGFDFNRGRVDSSHHPFCGGVSEDVRLTTRYNSLSFVESLMGFIHETGHACYEQGLPIEWTSQPVGMMRGMSIHESQSLLHEIFIGRSVHFINFMLPLIHKHFEVDPESPCWSLANLYDIFNRVQPGLIRVNADEVTYPAHVILRYEIERDLITQKIETKDIPFLWDEKMKSYLGVNSEGNYKDGCMQDVHWPAGVFGYFPSYFLGAMTAAQFFASLEKSIPNLNQKISQGCLNETRLWLKDHIWSKGSFYSSEDLIMEATGEPLNPIYFKNYIEKKYLSPPDTNDYLRKEKKRSQSNLNATLLLETHGN